MVGIDTRIGPPMNFVRVMYMALHKGTLICAHSSTKLEETLHLKSKSKHCLKLAINRCCSIYKYIIICHSLCTEIGSGPITTRLKQYFKEITQNVGGDMYNISPTQLLSWSIKLPHGSYNFC